MLRGKGKRKIGTNGEGLASFEGPTAFNRVLTLMM